ncbi:endonuclease/exonuclease/phosphatase family protein [Aquiflexum gelatinilyticum]|uniref:Endonuclease/exonuclease/phosphatase family protein n=1 Tax=Aquiflexum gelatinilyticum TaxID=2961943 RepID=A0A9X2P583_9BACT|nr:endonuclease/exonuclease/phosphatase family protein [Aquiflexum gelatinilyticum]MCR9016599.1 endonuclease/exonuclease/phosphatase family protein [Aquiflexum gelatinilyticum]
MIPSSIRVYSLVALFFIAYSFPVTFSLAQNMNIATYNIRFDNPNDIGNLWKDRAPHLINQIKFHKMDIIGTQEGMYHQLEEIKNGLGYPYVGVGRDKGGKEGEFSAVFYNPEKLKVLDQSTFWLSETPDKPSKGWDAALNRVCTWVKFENKEGKKFYIFNIHYDHIGQKAREESSKLVISKIKEINTENLPVVFMGDFNVMPDNPAYQTVLNNSDMKDSRLISKTPSIGNQGTFNGFNWEKLPEGIIDHIFVSPNITVLRHGILTDNYGMKYPSDHFPVMVEVSW